MTILDMIYNYNYSNYNFVRYDHHNNTKYGFDTAA